MSRTASKITGVKRLEWLKAKTGNYVESSSLVSLCLSLWPCYRNGFDVDSCTLCTASSDPESDFKVNRMKS